MKVLAILTAYAGLMGSASVTVAIAEQCKLENWRFENRSSYISIEGATSCQSGTIYIRGYDGNRFLGTATGYIQGNTFNTLISGAHAKELTIKYVIGGD